MNKQDFIKYIAPYIVTECKKRGYRYPSAIIAQAACESAWGASQLSAKYYNFFGMKCGSSYKGKSVNMKTKEEYTVGTLTTIRDNFRAYDNIAQGIAGYFEFIQMSRYQNLKAATSYRDYITRLKVSGWATSSTYINTLINIVEANDLDEYDKLIDGNAETSPVQTPDAATPDLNEAIKVIAKYVIKGYFGNGHDTRSKNIYEAVRKEVNNQC